MAYVFRRPSRRYFKKATPRILMSSLVARGPLAASEAPDVAAFAGGIVVPISGTLSASESPDVAAFGGSVTIPISGTLAASESPDVASFSGYVPATGTLGASESPDVAAFAGNIPGSGTLAASEAPDIATFIGIVRSDFTNVMPVNLPWRIEKDAKGGPRFNTSIFIGANGFEYRNVNWPVQIDRWSIALGYRDDDDQDFLDVLAIFYNARGNARGFLFKDWSDYRAKDQMLGIVEGEPTQFQLQKVYSIGTFSYARQITRPKSGTVVIKLAGVVQGGIDVDINTGIITGATSDMTASFEFNVPVRFDTDAMEIDVERDGLVNCPTIDLVEIKE